MPVLFMQMIKRCKVLVLFSLLVLLLPNTMVHASSKAVLGASTVYTEKTGTVNLSVFIDSDERIAGGSFELVYDPMLLTVRDKAVKSGPVFTTQLTAINSAEAGKIGVAWAQATGVSMNGVVIEFPATVTRDGAGKTINLAVKNAELYNEEGKKIAVQVLDGQVKPFKGDEKTYSGTVGVHKDWTIRLSTSYNAATLNEQTVTVKRGTTPVDVVVTRIDATTFKVTPKTQYAGGKHTLEITDQLRSANGGKLRQPIRHIFTVK